MKRFLIPFIIAILVHVLLLRLKGDWVQKRLFQAEPAPIALALTYVKPEAPPLPSPPPPTNDLQEKRAPIIQETKETETPKQPEAPTPEKPPAPKPKIVKRKPTQTSKPRKEIPKKETLVSTPSPAPSPRPPLENEKPLLPPAPSPPTVPETAPDPLALGPASPQQILGDPSPPQPDLKPDGDQQLAARTPVRTMKEAVPIYRQNPPPSYPRIARRRGYEGTVVLEVLVGREGKVRDLRVFKSCGHSVLDEAAADSVRAWLFEPGKLADEPVEMWVRVPIRFQLAK